MLALCTEERSGREIAREYERQTGLRLPYGTLYTLVKEMAERRWVTVRETDEGGDGRVRWIEITRAGEGALQRAALQHARLAALAQQALAQRAAS